MSLVFLRNYRKFTRIYVFIAAVLMLIIVIGSIFIMRNRQTVVVSGSSVHSISIDGHERTYRIYRPESLPTGNVPLVVMLHGALGTGEQAETTYGWDAKAESGKFIVAYPDGANRSWAVSEKCCGPSARNGTNDVAFITQMVSNLSQEMPIDQDRIYATGISNGGMLAYRLACDTDIFAAIAPVAATMLGACPSPNPISVMHIHGALDETVPYGGGPGRRDNGGGGNNPADTNGPPIPELVDAWRRTAECEQPTIAIVGVVTTSTANCPDGRAVNLVTIADAGHQWPGSVQQNQARRFLKLDTPSTALDATDAIWQFFRAHPKS
jgi:polyhydroxybutyrate depolymerase